MTNIEALHDQVAGILSRYKVSFTEDEGQSEFGIYRGSAAVFIRFAEIRGAATVSLSAPIVFDVPLGEDQGGQACRLCNSLNCENNFGKFCLYPDDADSVGTVALEYDLLGGHLQGEELMGALDEITGMADFFDDHLTQALGGKSYQAMVQDSQGGVET